MESLHDDKVKQAILNKSMSEIMPNLFLFGIGAFVIVLLLKYVWWWLGIAGLVVYGAILLFDIARLLFVVGCGFVLLFSKAESAKAQALSWGATFVQLIETTIFAIYTAILYWYLFPNTI